MHGPFTRYVVITSGNLLQLKVTTVPTYGFGAATSKCPSIMPEDKVLIIGAGLGGLVLAHILHNNGVPFEIFERDAETSHRNQGWAVALVE